MFDALNEIKIPGCFLIKPKVFKDARGAFVKVFNEHCFKDCGLMTDFREQYYSISAQGVVRGLHFQLPPHDHAKLVYCTSGEVFDAVVDLRKGSPTYGEFYTTVLTAGQGEMLYIPSGLAHGFCVLSESVTMVYNVTSVYCASHDAGVRWDSMGIPWPSARYMLSERDRRLPVFSKFNSPFRFVD